MRRGAIQFCWPGRCANDNNATPKDMPNSFASGAGAAKTGANESQGGNT